MARCSIEELGLKRDITEICALHDAGGDRLRGEDPEYLRIAGQRGAGKTACWLGAGSGLALGLSASYAEGGARR